MGRLTLNILLSFAQFEREVIGERIRDKFAASRKRGMWMGGLGAARLSTSGSRKLVVERSAEAALVRRIFAAVRRVRFSDHAWLRSAAGEGVTDKRGRADSTKAARLHTPGCNRVYLGEAVHKGTAYPGEHDAIVPRDVRDRAHSSPAGEPAGFAASRNRIRTAPALLRRPPVRCRWPCPSPTFTRGKAERLYRYYVSQAILKGSGGTTLAPSTSSRERSRGS
jgi:hypothetical protein